MASVAQLRKYHPLFTLEQEVNITSNNTSQVTSAVNYALKNVHVYISKRINQNAFCNTVAIVGFCQTVCFPLASIPETAIKNDGKKLAKTHPL